MENVGHKGSMETVCFLDMLCFTLITIKIYITDEKRLLKCHIANLIPSKVDEAKRVQFFCKLILFLDHSSREHKERSVEGNFVQKMQPLERTP